MDEPKDKPEGQGQPQQPESGESKPADEPRKQPRVWVKPGTPPAAKPSPPTSIPETPAPQAGEGAEQPPTGETAPAAEEPRKQPKVWVKPGATGAAPASAPEASRAPPAAPATDKAAAPEKKPAREEIPTYLDISQDPLVLRLGQSFSGAVLSAQSFLNQKILTIDAPSILPVCDFLKEDSECEFDLLEDLTAVDYPDREKRFVVVYHLCSLQRNTQVRLKCNIGEHEEISSVTPVWSGANWLEREVYDMFGIVFSGHPDLKRILLPLDWVGHPLRKDHDLRKQDEDWIRRHLQIRK